MSLAGGGMLSFTANGNIEFNQGDILILSAALIRGFQIFMFGRQTAGKDYSLINITIVTKPRAATTSNSINVILISE